LELLPSDGGARGAGRGQKPELQKSIEELQKTGKMKRTIEADIREGKIHPRDPDKLPRKGKLFLIVLNEESIQLDPERMKNLIGSLKMDIDFVQWQRNIRSEWDSRL
jgi:hypothetical protein